MADEPQVSDQQVEATKLDKERQKLAEKDPLVPDPNPTDTSGPAHYVEEKPAAKKPAAKRGKK